MKVFSLTMIYFIASVYHLLAQSLEGIDQDHLPSVSAEILKPVIKTIKLPTKVELEYAEQGNPDGIPVIFLHGITDSWHSFESVLPHLPKSIYAFALTQRGHGNSSKPDGGYHPKNFAEDVAAFISKKKLGPVVIIGHSMGGLNAQQFALDYPQLVRGIVIIDSDPVFKDNPGMPEFYQEVLKLDKTIDKKFMVDFQKATLAKPIDSVYFNLLVEEGLKAPARVFKAAFKGIMEVDFSEDLKKINAPALIFWGDRDSFCSRKGQDILRMNIKNSKLVIYEGTGHALHWEQPEHFANDLVQFIDTIK